MTLVSLVLLVAVVLACARPPRPPSAAAPAGLPDADATASPGPSVVAGQARPAAEQPQGEHSTPAPTVTPAPARVLRYRVEQDDTVSTIAAKFGVSAETIIWANKLEDAPDRLSVGQQLVFPSISGVIHEVQHGDTVADIARRYLVDSAGVLAANLLDPAAPLAVGRQLIVPGGRLKRLDVAAGAASSATPQPPPLGAAAGPAREEASARGGSRAPLSRVQPDYNVDPNPDHWAFLDAAIEPARASQAATGVPASVTIGQAIHESAWGASRLSREGHNYFGIKATAKPGSAGVIYMKTWEHIKGKDVTVNAPFRAYRNMTDSFVDHGRFFVENDRYARAMANTADPRAFLRLISEAGYATDPAYVRKVLAYMDRFNLYQYDR